MSGLLICAAVVALVGGVLCYAGGFASHVGDRRLNLASGLALIAAALYLAYAAGGA